jgi:cell division protein FtsB
VFLCSLLLLIFFFFSFLQLLRASTSNALPTIESLNAEKAKLEAEREKLEDELEAGVSDVAERVAIRQQIAGIYTRMTAVQANITAIRTQITASINAPSKPSRATDVEMPPGIQLVASWHCVFCFFCC